MNPKQKQEDRQAQLDFVEQVLPLLEKLYMEGYRDSTRPCQRQGA